MSDMSKQFAVLLALSLLCGCASSPEQKPVQSSPAGDLVSKADAAFDAGRYRDAAEGYQECWDNYPRGSMHYPFTQRLGDCYVFLGQLERARKTYTFGIKQYQFPKFDIERRIARLKRQ